MRTAILLEEAKTRYLRALGTRALGRRFTALETVDSTNAFLLRLSDEEAEGAACAALRQSAGRGRLGRSWASEGGGLYFSFAVSAETPDMLLLLPLAAACAAVKALEDAGVQSARIKWPNDILLSGRKLAGILCQSRGARAVAGIGVNLAQTREEFLSAGLPDAVSLSMLGHTADPWTLAAGIVTRAEPYLGAVSRGETQALLRAYRAKCLSIGRELIAAGPDGEIRGVGADIDEKGRLILETPQGRVCVESGEVRLRGAKGYI